MPPSTGALSAAKGQIDPEMVARGRRTAILAGRRWVVRQCQCDSYAPGLGSRVIERMIGTIKGKTRFDWRPEGLFANHPSSV